MFASPIRTRFVLTLFVLPFAFGACAPLDEVEPSGDELATDAEEARARCGGPFNCRLVNPTSDGANRYDNPDRSDGLWPVRANTEMVDGFGRSMGTMRSTATKINFGQRKRIGGAAYVYAFSTLTTRGTRSGWIREDAVDSTALRAMPTVDARDPGMGFYDTPYVVSGGDPARYGDDRVLPRVCDPSESIRATDYLVKWDGVVHLQYALPGFGGVATDTVPVGAAFRRARGVATVTTDLYATCSSRKVGELHFIYGQVAGRFGWLAREALSVGTPTATVPSNTGNLSATRPEGRVCEAHCRNREAYHEVPGVSVACTEHARAFCTANDRGAFIDARWR